MTDIAAVDDREMLARTIYGEARGESRGGKFAVGRVIVNRFESRKWFAGKTIAETCLKPWQFSCWNANDPNRAKLLEVSLKNPTMIKCLRAADEALEGPLRYGLGWLEGCTHYHTTAVAPKWAEGKKPAGQIGTHLFYKGID